MTDPSVNPGQSARRLSNLLAAAIFLLALAARLVPGPRTIDDSYITYRYARNILGGHGFVYNPGERVLGTTTPLYTFLMVLGGAASGGAEAPFAQNAMILNALADGAVCLVLLRLGRRLGFVYGGAGAALAWAVAPFSVTFAIGGLETSLYVMLLMGAACAHLERRRILTALLSALALLTRPDALLLVGLLAVDRAWQVIQDYRGGNFRAKPVLAEALVFLAPTLGWLIFGTIYFGSPIPHSIAAKSLAYHLSPEEGLVRLLQHYTTPFLEHLTFGTTWIGVGLLLYPFLYLVGSRQALRISTRIWPLALYPWLYFAVFALANPLIFRWYLTPPLPAYFFFILAGAETVLRSLRKAALKRKYPEQVTESSFPFVLGLIALVVLAPALLSMRDWKLHPDHGLDRPAPEMAWYQLELLYRQAAESLEPDLRRSVLPAPVLAAGDVGVLGFVTGINILDTVGLNSPQSSAYYPLDPDNYVINYAIPAQLVLDAQPDYLVILEVYGRAGLLQEPRFWESYRLRQKIPTDIYGSDGMLILERIQP